MDMAVQKILDALELQRKHLAQQVKMVVNVIGILIIVFVSKKHVIKHLHHLQLMSNVTIIYQIVQ